MPGSTQPDTNNSATSPSSAAPSTAATYGPGWDAQKCADAHKQGKHVDAANCPAPPKPKG
jgi:hypothetical protein